MMLILCALLLMPVQEVEYGKPEDLRGLKRVFIDTGSDLQAREHLTKALRKLNLEFLDSAEGAEFLIVFKSGKDRKLMGSSTPVSGSVAEVDLITGEAKVFIPKGNKIRLVMTFEDTQNNIFEKKPIDRFSKEFIKMYKQANGIK